MIRIVSQSFNLIKLTSDTTNQANPTSKNVNETVIIVYCVFRCRKSTTQKNENQIETDIVLLCMYLCMCSMDGT
jgi:hypothetical protein